MSGKSILITGGAGFIGRAIVARCLDAGHRVTVLDNLCAGRMGNLEAFQGRVEFAEGDILDEARVREVMEHSKPEVVFHMAAHHFIPFCNEHPSETLRVNGEGTHVVLSEAARQGVRTAVVASSGAFYPSQEEVLGEDLAPKPVDVYGLSKMITEEVASFVSATTGMACVAARLFNTYGPYETNPHLIPHIMESLHQGPRVQLGNIFTKRDYVFVEDVADLLFRCSERRPEGFTVVNVGTGVEYSAEEIVGTISELLGRPIEIESDASRARAVDKLHQRADTRRLRELTGAVARHDLRDGLRKLLAHEGLNPSAEPDLALAEPS